MRIRPSLPAFFIASLLLPSWGIAQTAVPFSSDRWTLEGNTHTVETYLGEESLRLQGGRATLSDVAFTEGILEFDVAFSTDRNFLGVFWRQEDASNFEQFYLRPHQSGKPDANQYTPVLNGLTGWQLYHGPGYGMPVDYAFDEWMPVRIVVARERAEVYIRDMETPVLVTHTFKRERAAGPIGVYAGNLHHAHFANFRYTQTSNPLLKGTPPEVPPAPEGSILSWDVSTPFSESSLASVHTLTDAHKANLDWTTLASESTGITNLSYVTTGSQENNTVFARVMLESNRTQTVPLQLGYSDRVRVYLNDAVLYSGQNDFRSRDFRYLGTIGLFDTIYLNLQEGANELWIAVSENFGGWGIQAALPPNAGVRVQ